jgi:hypothetical protein
MTLPSVIAVQPPFILTGLAQLIALISKSGWFVDDAYKSTLATVSTTHNLTSTTTTTTNNSNRVLLLMSAMHILTALVAEMNNPVAAAKNPSRHRKVGKLFL